MTNLDSMKRPFQVTALGWLFIAVGIVSSAYHLWKSPLDRWAVPILLVGIIAIVAGGFLLRGARWASWVALGWLAFHVVVSALNSLADALPHLVLLLVVGYFLLNALSVVTLGFPGFVRLFIVNFGFGLCLTYFMLFRGFLFAELHGTTRRSRVYRYNARSSN